MRQARKASPVTEVVAPLVLASASPTRRALLAAAGVGHDSQPATIDEAALSASLLREGATPAGVALALAREKARAIAARCPARLVLGADQTLDDGSGHVLHRAQSRSEARAHLVRLRGRLHRLHAAAVLMRGDDLVWSHVATATLAMRAFSDAFLDHYLEGMSDAVLLSVGCYQIEGLGAQLFDAVAGDPFTIQGLPLLPLLGALRVQGVVPT